MLLNFRVKLRKDFNCNPAILIGSIPEKYEEVCNGPEYITNVEYSDTGEMRSRFYEPARLPEKLH